MIETEQAQAEQAEQAEQQCGMSATPVKEHEWLHKLVGEWTYELEAPAGPGGPLTSFTGTERVRSIAGLWVVSEGSGDGPDGGMGETVLTLGYDPQKGRFVGTWFGSMMTYLWVYDGSLDASERVLTLECDGPSFEVEGTMTKYRDVVELLSDDHRTLTARALGQDGQWHELMTTHYRRMS